MYQLTQPYINYTNAQLESVRNAMQQNPMALMQPEALSQLMKTSIENYSRFVQELTQSFSTLASEAQGQMSRTIEESARTVQQAARTGGIIVAETVDTETSGEIDIANARASARRRG